MERDEDMKEKQKLEVKSIDGIFSKVYLNGKELKGVRSLNIDLKAGKRSVTTLELCDLDISIDSPVIIAEKTFGNIEEITFEDGMKIGFQRKEDTYVEDIN